MPGPRLWSVALLALLFTLVPPIVFAQADPVAVFRQAVDARNRGDLDGLMSLFAEDAVRQDGTCPNCVGTAAIRESMQQNIDEHFQATVLTAQAAGDMVTASAELRSDVFRAGGAERVISNFRLEVRQGKLVLWSSTLDTTDPRTAAFVAARQAAIGQPAAAPAQVPRALPRTGEAPASSPLTAVAGSLVVVLGLILKRQHHSAWRSLTG
jgi:ketosteroid isomerase-like protein